MPNPKFQNLIVWIKSQQKKLWISWICSNLDLENRRIWIVGLKMNFRRFREAVYIDGVQRRMTNSRSSFEVSGPGTTGNERTSQSDMENVLYNCKLYYGTCQSFGSIYSFFIHIYKISYLSGSTNQRSDKLRKRSYHAI